MAAGDRARKSHELFAAKEVRGERMVVVMQSEASEEQVQKVIDRLVALGFDIHRSTGVSQTVLGAVGVRPDFDPRDIELLPGVREVVRITQPYKLASRVFRPEGTIVELLRGVRVGGPEVVVAAGPCAVESAEQIESIAARVAKAGARLLRGRWSHMSKIILIAWTNLARIRKLGEVDFEHRTDWRSARTR